MRRKDFRGDQEASGAVLLIMSRSCVMCGCAKTAGLLRLVMRMVLVGFAGCVNGGMQERSRERWDARDDARERVLGDGAGERLGERAGDSCIGECCGDSIAVIVVEGGVWV
jgi:hypothetical protein